MSLGIAARIARRELRGGLRGFRVFLACLALGIAAIAAVGTVRESIEAGLQREGATLLGGDAEVQFTYRFAEPEERAFLDSIATEVAEVVDFRSMAVVGEGDERDRGLTQVKAVDGVYPIYGAVTLAPEMTLAEALDGTGGLPGAVMDPVLIDRLGLSVGETFRLGTQSFVLSAALEREPDDGGGGFELGPRTLVRTSALSESGLLVPGTLYETEYRLRVPPGADLDALEAQADAVLDETGFRWRDRRNGAPGVSEFVDRLSAFLVLVGLAGLAVGGVGVAAAVRAHLDGKTGTIAVLKTLGAEGRTIFEVYLIQVGVLALVGVVLGVSLGAGLPLLFSPVIAAQLPVPADFGLHAAPLAQAALYGLLAAAIFTLWPLARTREVRAAALFRDIGGLRVTPHPGTLAVIAGLVVLLVGLAAWLSGLPELTLWAAAGLSAAFVVLLGAAWLVRRVARRLARARVVQGRSALRLALGAVGGPGGEATSVVLSLGLGLSVLAAIGQIDTNLRSAISRDLPEVAPAFFMVDIQPDQIDGFRERLDTDPAVSRVETAPMLRGIITRINDRPADEVAGDHWVLQGDRGVTYSDRPGDDTTITAGEWWPEAYDGPPQISFAAEEAAELGVSLGDTLTINILGRDITGEITSFREVDFSTAGIGFVLAMNPAALRGAPHTYISTIYAEPQAEAAILRDISDTYPNITAIRVRDAIDRVSEVLAGVAAAVTYGAMATLVTGAVVLIGAAAAGERARTYEAAILKTVGAGRRRILTSFALRSALLGAAAGVVAVAAGGGAGWAVSRFVMETEFRFAPLSALAIVVGGVLLTLAAGLVFAWRPLAARPASILRARE
ncbi:putative ABC transport system permease protein [Tranquillimonas rosea]|uniref:Putative ABC transport system permease protein n=1 Tax=Tranquillimonas rosea TaxID=641238 RepID=A0A1H9R9X6_9RHOB|nr:FtsX-like permease family protein [Tranquillimonas rosea]SER69480.1 putative ABC transport system permease protein [Tranquillimonas rosea]